nr:inositol monophosphatase family protein [Rhizobium sp. CFBP 8752]
MKPDGSPVTKADVFLEKAIASHLNSRIPGLRFIGEETGDTETTTGSEWVAVLDPIDGTENFCSGLKEWGVSLSIWKAGEHKGSMLMLPELQEVALSGNIPRVPRSRIVGFSSSFSTEIADGIARHSESRIMGCAVYNLFNVIRGAYSRFINPKGAYNWDLLAGVALAREAGCEIKINGQDYDGRFLEANQRYRVDIQHRYDIHPR